MTLETVFKPENQSMLTGRPRPTLTACTVLGTMEQHNQGLLGISRDQRGLEGIINTIRD